MTYDMHPSAIPHDFEPFLEYSGPAKSWEAAKTSCSHDPVAPDICTPKLISGYSGKRKRLGRLTLQPDSDEAHPSTTHTEYGRSRSDKEI